MGTFLYLAIIGFVVSSVVLLLWDERRQLHVVFRLYSSGWWAYVRGLGLAFFTLNLGIAGFAVAPDILQISWLEWLPDAPRSSAVAAPLHAGARAGGMVGLTLVLVFYVGLLLVMPFIVRKEEALFRRGHRSIRPMITQSLKFGFMHALFGVPLVLCLVLTATGFLFARRYARTYLAAIRNDASETTADESALQASTVDHLMHNFWLITLIAVGATWVLIFPRP